MFPSPLCFHNLSRSVTLTRAPNPYAFITFYGPLPLHTPLTLMISYPFMLPYPYTRPLFLCSHNLLCSPTLTRGPYPYALIPFNPPPHIAHSPLYGPPLLIPYIFQFPPHPPLPPSPPPPRVDWNAWHSV
jgi:hypothetical protein